MKRMLNIAVAAALPAATALATNLNTSVESGGSNAINVSPGQVVQYQVIGELDDMLNEGLALVGFDLEFSGGDLEQADEPVDGTNMAQFKRPNGVTNPAGYGGTIIDGALRQVGGGANTINNDINNAPFPLGIVITGIAHPGSPEVLVTGALTIPNDALENDVFTLNLTNLFANVIKQGETGEPPQNFWKTEAAGAGTNVDLTMTVSSVTCDIVGSTPGNCAVDARQPHELNDGNILQGWDTITLEFACNTASVIADDYTVTCSGGVCPTIANVAQGATEFDRVITLSQVIPAGEWTCVEDNESGDSRCIGSLPGDANLDGTSAPADILGVIDCLNGVANFPCELANTDIDRSDEAGPPDILRVIDLLNGASEFEIWLDAQLPVCPSGE